MRPKWESEYWGLIHTVVQCRKGGSTIKGDYMTQEVMICKRPDEYESVDKLYMQENVIEKDLVNEVEPLNLELATFVDQSDEELHGLDSR